ncbi:hypothetical protein GCM10009581_17520 [Tsukamurella strandjordii]
MLMNLAVQSPASTRYAGAGVAILTAATLAVTPMAASAAGVTAPTVPPIVKDIGGAASALANWAVDSGMKFVKDPLTGVIKLVSDQVGNVTVIGGVLAEGAQQIITSIGDDLPGALAEAQKLIAAGKYGDAWQAVANTFTGPVLGALLNGMTPIMNQLGPQIGPLADAFQAAMLPIIGLVLPPLATVVTLPAHLLDGIGAATKALTAGDPVGAVNALIGTARKVGEFTVESLFGDFGVVKGITGLIPAIISGLAGSEWATKGPFATKDGTPVSFGPASAATLAASPTAVPAFPGLPQLQEIGKIWQDTFKTVTEGLTGEYGLPSLVEVFTKNLPKGELSFSYTKIHGVLGAVVLGLGAGVLQTGTVLNPFLGPLGKGLDAASNDLLRLTLGAYNFTRDLGAVPLAELEKVGKALMAGDPFAVLQAVSAGIATSLGTVVNGIFAPGEEFSPGLLPALLSVTKSFIDGASGKAPAPGVARASGDTVAPVAVSDSAAGSANSAAAVSGGSSVTPATPKAETPEKPVVETPKVETPVVETPKVETPKVETPKTETPKTETPKAETPKAETPVETPKAEVPTIETPTTGGSSEGTSGADSSAGSAAGGSASDGAGVETAAAA